MTFAGAAVFCVVALHSPAYLISLQTDRDGNPSGTKLSSSSYVPLSKSWSTIPLEPASLLQGGIYHLVLQHDPNRGGEHPVGRIDADHFASFLSTDVLNGFRPTNGTPDPRANVLRFEKGKWKTLNQEPVYVIFGSGLKFQGNPYDDPGVRPIHGNGTPGNRKDDLLQGQVLHFHCGYTAKGLAVRLKKRGHPAAPLNVRVLKHDFHDHKAFPLYELASLDPKIISTEFKWVTMGFDNIKIPGFAPECWFFVFQSDSGKAGGNPTECEDCYLISDVGNSGGLSGAADLTFDGGPHLSRATCSRDGGSAPNWMDEFERDANVVAVGPDCPPLPIPAVNPPIPTPLPLGNGRRFAP